MLRLGAIFRLLVLVLCLVPFTNSQQASGALALFLTIAPVPPGECPDAPVNEEEEDEREDPDSKVRHAPQSRYCTPRRELVAMLFSRSASQHTHTTRPRTTPPVAADPFCNGLGTPYRC